VDFASYADRAPLSDIPNSNHSMHRINTDYKFTIEYFAELTVDLTFHYLDLTLNNTAVFWLV